MYEMYDFQKRAIRLSFPRGPLWGSMLNIRGVDKTSHFRPGRAAFLSHSCCCQGEMPMDDAQGPARFYYDMSLYTGSFQIGRDGFGGGFISHDFQEDGITYAQILCLARKMMGSVSTRRSYMLHIFVYGFSYFIFIFASLRFFLLFLPILRFCAREPLPHMQRHPQVWRPNHCGQWHLRGFANRFPGAGIRG